VSKIESSLDQLVAKLGQLKNVGKARLCTLWQKLSPITGKTQQLDFLTVKSLVIRYKWRILLVLIVLYAGSKTYDYFFPAGKKAGGPQVITSVVVEKKDIPLIIEATGTTVSNSIVDIRPMVTNTVAKIHIKDGEEVKEGQLLFTLDEI
jgi:multidrug efflux pump subunit AcrA (membrane-fusion protein)